MTKLNKIMAAVAAGATTFGVASSNIAEASIINLYATGRVSQGTGSIMQDANFAAHFTMDTSILDGATGDPEIGYYGSAVRAFSLTSGDFSVSGDDGPTTWVFDGSNMMRDALSVFMSSADIDNQMGDLAGRTIADMEFSLIDFNPGSTRFSSDSLVDALSNAGTLNSFPTKYFNIRFADNYNAVFAVDNIYINTVPTPAAFIPGVLALAGVAAYKRRRDKQTDGGPSLDI